MCVPGFGGSFGVYSTRASDVFLFSLVSSELHWHEDGPANVGTSFAIATSQDRPV